MSPDALRANGLGRRRVVVVTLAALAVVAWVALGLSPAELVPSAGGLDIARDFLGAALRPALTYEAADVPDGAGNFLLGVLAAVWRTIVFAAAALSLALVASVPLAFVASTSWWAGDPGHQRRRLRVFGPTLQIATRVLIAALRSVHELLWAVVLLAAVGLNSASAVLALAIPYTGTLAKVFSEMLDETDPDAARALRGIGAGPLRAFLFGRLPRALPDMTAYAFYRFECAVRSSAVLGFFGFPTLGYGLEASFENLHYREVWTYLYALLVLVLVLEGWSAALRRRFVA